MTAVRAWFLMLGLTACVRSAVPMDPVELSLPAETQIVSFASGSQTLYGLLLRPPGPGPHRAILFHHGSAEGVANHIAFANIAPQWVARGYLVFMPYRRGQGLSAAAGAYMGDQIEQARRAFSMEAAASVQLRLLEGEHLADSQAALAWLRDSGLAQPDRIVAMGNSVGGIEVVLGVEVGGYCAGVDLAGAAISWKNSPGLRQRMIAAVRAATAPILLIQALNDFDLSPSLTLSAVLQRLGKPVQLLIYPPFGSSPAQGHAFAYRGVRHWVGDTARFLDAACPVDATAQGAVAGADQSASAAQGQG